MSTTSLLALQRLGSLGNIASGGSAPLGDATIWPTVANWAALATIASPRTGDRAGVATIGPGNAAGVARWSGSQWELVEGIFDAFADMEAFAEPVRTGASALVEETGDLSENGVAYLYDGGWSRTAALSTGYAWALSSLTNTDPSGVGATKVGDLGVYANPTSGAVDTYRLRSVTIDAAIGGGTLLTWVPSAIYGEAGLTIRGYLTGTETMPARGSAIQGYTVLGSGTGSVTSSAGEIVLTCSVSGTFAGLQSTYVLQPTDKVYIRQTARVNQVAATAMTYFHLLFSGGTTQPQWVVTQNPTVSSGALIPSTTAPTLVGSTLMIDPLTALGTSTAELVEIMARSSTGAVTLRRNNQLAFSIRRNAQTGTATGQHLMQVATAATGACTHQLSQHLFMTY
jgi:hypothetical protein